MSCSASDRTRAVSIPVCFAITRPGARIQELAATGAVRSMLPVVLAMIAAARLLFRNRSGLAVEVLALRQQVAVLTGRRTPPQLRLLDPLWTVLPATWLVGSAIFPCLAGNGPSGNGSFDIGLDFGSIGIGNLGRVTADRESPRKFAS